MNDTDDALASRDPARVAHALRELRDRLPPRPPVVPPPPEVLDAFPDGPPGEVARDYIWVIAHYHPSSRGSKLARSSGTG